jgi:cytochrome c551/c552
MKRFLVAITVLTMLASCGGSEQSTQQEHENHPGMSKGKAIFIANCNTCHKLNDKLVGPALTGALARWNNDTTRIRAFIKNSQEAIHNGDKRAQEVYKEFNETIMTPMPHLTDADINEVLDYINKGVE